MEKQKKCSFASPAPATKHGATSFHTANCAYFYQPTAPDTRHSFPTEKNQKGEKKMPRTFVDFRPAEICHKKETYVFYYVKNPYTGQMVRKRIRCNGVGSGRADRLRYARLVCKNVNELLFNGWNPFLEEIPNGAATITEAVERFTAEKNKTVRQRTAESYRSSASLFLQWLQMRGMADAHATSIDRAAVTSYLDWSAKARHLSNRSYNNYALFMYTLFQWLTDKGYCAANPAAGIPRRRVDRKTRTIIPKCDRKRIAEWTEEHCPRFIYAMLLCYRLFIRPKEICGLKVGYIDLQNRLIRIPSFVAKNHSDRVLGIPDELMQYFNKLSELPENYYVFAKKKTCEPGPKPMAPTRLAEIWKKMRDELNLPASYQFYSLKDTGITEMLEAGVPPKYVKELADHYSLEMTEKYTHRSDAMKILEWNRLEF